MDFAERLDNLIEDNDINYRILSDNTNITQPVLSRYKNRKMLPCASNLIKIAKYFDVSIDWLLGLRG